MRVANRFVGDHNGIVGRDNVFLGSGYLIDVLPPDEALLQEICSINFASRLLLPMPPIHTQQ